MTLRRLAWIVLTTLLVIAVNVGVSYLYVAIYAHLVNPGHDNAFYEAHARLTAPYSSIIAGIPIVFFFCRWLARRWEPEFALKAALSVWLLYVLVDISILASAGMLRGLVVLATVSHVTKLGAAYFGGKSAESSLRTALSDA